MIEFQLVHGAKKAFDVAKDTQMLSTTNVAFITITGEELKMVRNQFPNLKLNNSNNFLKLDGELMRFVVNNFEFSTVKR